MTNNLQLLQQERIAALQEIDKLKKQKPKDGSSAEGENAAEEMQNEIDDLKEKLQESEEMVTFLKNLRRDMQQDKEKQLE